MERGKTNGFGNKDPHEERLRSLYPDKRQVQGDAEYMPTKMLRVIIKR